MKDSFTAGFPSGECHLFLADRCLLRFVCSLKLGISEGLSENTFGGFLATCSSGLDTFAALLRRGSAFYDVQIDSLAGELWYRLG